MGLFGPKASSRSRTQVRAPGGTANAPYVKLDPSKGGDPAVVQEREAMALRQSWLSRQLRRNRSTGIKI